MRRGLKTLFLCGIGLAVAAYLGISALWAVPPQKEPISAPAVSGDVNDVTDGLRISGPFHHENLAVYLLHSDDRDDRDFLTLNEGLKKGLVKVSEMKNAQVRQLTVENLSDQPLFLQEGDRVTGGKQDRTLYTSLVIAPKSGKQPLPSFCIESGRWAPGASGLAFTGNRNSGYAANSVRLAGKLLRSQSAVWLRVAQTKGLLMRRIGTMNANSSLNEALDDKKVVAATKAFTAALGKLAQKHRDLVGVAFAVNGKVQEVNVYPGQKLVAKIYPRLLETYALDAIMQAKPSFNRRHPPRKPSKPAAKLKHPSKDAVLAFIKTSMKEQAVREEKIDGRNRLEIFVGKRVDPVDKTCVFQCRTRYQGKFVHLQWIKAPQMQIKAPGLQNLNPNPSDNRQPQQRNRRQSNNDGAPQRQD